MKEHLFFKDPYVLDYLGLKDTYSEKDLENGYSIFIIVDCISYLISLILLFSILSNPQSLKHRILNILIKTNLKLINSSGTTIAISIAKSIGSKAYLAPFSTASIFFYFKLIISYCSRYH